MVKIVYVSSSGKRREVEAKPGMTVMEAATKAGIDEIVAECGGACACATCQVYVAPEWIENCRRSVRWKATCWISPSIRARILACHARSSFPKTWTG